MTRSNNRISNNLASTHRFAFGRIAARWVAPLVAGIALAAAAVAVPAPANAQQAPTWEPGLYMVQASGRILAAARALTNSTAYGYDSDGHCFYAGWCRRQENLNVTRTFQAGQTYVLLSGGDDDARDVDILVTDENGQRVAMDNDDSAAAVVAFQPETTQRYNITVRLHAGRTRASFLALAILEKGGYDVPVQNLEASLGTMLVALAAASNNADFDVNFVSQAGAWAVFGAVLQQNRSIDFAGLQLGHGAHVFSGFGDSNCHDVDMGVFLGSTLVQGDVRSTRYALVTMGTEAGQAYTVRLKNSGSRGASLIVGGITVCTPKRAARRSTPQMMLQ